MICKFKVVTILGGKRCFKNRAVTLDDSWYDHWFFQGMLEKGLVEIVEPPATAAADTTKKTTKK